MYISYTKNTYIYFSPFWFYKQYTLNTENLKSVESIKKQTLVTIPATRGTTNDISF